MLYIIYIYIVYKKYNINCYTLQIYRIEISNSIFQHYTGFIIPPCPDKSGKMTNTPKLCAYCVTTNDNHAKKIKQKTEWIKNAVLRSLRAIN